MAIDPANIILNWYIGLHRYQAVQDRQGTAVVNVIYYGTGKSKIEKRDKGQNDRPPKNQKQEMPPFPLHSGEFRQEEITKHMNHFTSYHPLAPRTPLNISHPAPSVKA